MKKALIICPEISGNPFTRTLPFLQALKDKYEFSIIGPLKKEPYVWDNSIKARFFNTKSNLPKGLKLIYSVFKTIKIGLKENHDFILGFKLLPQILIPGVIIKKLKNRKFFLDIDDVEYKLTDSFFKKILIKLSEKLLKKANKVLASSKFLSEKYNAVFIPSCVDVNWTKKTNKNLINNVIKKHGLKNKIIVGYIGAFREHKGIDILINAVKSANEKIPNLKLVLIGSGPNEEKLRKIAGDETVFLGFVSHESLQNYFKLIDIFVIPYPYNEISKAQTPVKIFEAMAMKKAIIATNTSGMKDILSGAGIITNPSKEELANEIVKLSKNKRLIQNLGKKAFNLYLKNFTLKKMHEKIKENLF